MTGAWPHRLDGTTDRGNTSVNALRALLRIGPDPDEQASAVELLKRTPLDQLEEKVRELKMLHPAAEVRKAMVECIARAPLGDFETLKHIYLKHCGDTPK
jgi:hypothetical protein